jgi:peptidase inhibitor I78 family protein
MRLVFLAPLLVAGCAEVATAPVQNPIPAPVAPRGQITPPAATRTPPTQTAPRPARTEARASTTKPKPLPNSVIDAVNEPSSNSSSSSTPTAPTPAKPLAESCKEGSWWGLIGRPRAAANIVSEPKRVYTEGDPVTMDANPNRTNIVLDAEGKIAKVTCG